MSRRLLADTLFFIIFLNACLDFLFKICYFQFFIFSFQLHAPSNNFLSVSHLANSCLRRRRRLRRHSPDDGDGYESKIQTSPVRPISSPSHSASKNEGAVIIHCRRPYVCLFIGKM